MLLFCDHFDLSFHFFFFFFLQTNGSNPSNCRDFCSFRFVQKKPINTNAENKINNSSEKEQHTATVAAVKKLISTMKCVSVMLPSMVIMIDLSIHICVLCWWRRRNGTILSDKDKERQQQVEMCHFLFMSLPLPLPLLLLLSFGCVIFIVGFINLLNRF